MLYVLQCRRPALHVAQGCKGGGSRPLSQRPRSSSGNFGLWHRIASQSRMTNNRPWMATWKASKSLHNIKRSELHEEMRNQREDANSDLERRL